MFVPESIFLHLQTDHQSKPYKQNLGNHSNEAESSQWPITPTYDLEDGSTLNVEEKANNSNKNNK